MTAFLLSFVRGCYNCLEVILILFFVININLYCVMMSFGSLLFRFFDDYVLFAEFAVVAHAEFHGLYPVF